MKVSAVIPTYNYGHFATAAVESALAQTHRPLEVIVVDDGSTDDTRERMAKFGDRIIYIYQANKHLSAARNTGIRAARGDLIALLDSDDVWAPEKLAQQVAVFERFPETGLVSTSRFAIDREGKRLEPEIPVRPGEFVELDVRALLEFPCFCPSSVMIRKTCFEAVGLFDEQLRSVEDMDMWLRVAAKYPVKKLTGALTGFRVHHGSMSTRPEPMLENHLKVLGKFFSGKRPLLRHIAEARLYREVAWMRHANGDNRGAFRDVMRSLVRWPFALRDSEGRKARWQRARLAVGYMRAQ